MKFESSTIMYGMQSIPVKISSRHKSSTSITSTACPDCQGDIGKKNYCKSCGKEHESANLLSAIKVTKDEKHVFSKDEIKSLKETDNVIEVLGKMPKASMDIARINKTWAVIPDSDKKGSIKAKPWETLRQALFSGNDAIVVKVYHRGSERIAALTADQRCIVMHGLVFEDEFHQFDVVIEKPELSEAEQKMGESFVKSLKEIDVSTIENKTRAKLLSLIEGEPMLVVAKQTDDMSFFSS